MRYGLNTLFAVFASFAFAACSSEKTVSEAKPDHTLETQSDDDISVAAPDGVTVFGTLYFGELESSAPLIHLFHQGGSNGRGEYEPLAAWLNENGFRAIAWDLRSGGELHGEANRTAATVTEQPSGYCDAYQDLEAALTSAQEVAADARVVVWGSSYSGSLVFKAAAEHPELVDAVIGFSPASGGPMAACKASLFADSVEVPAFALRPASELERESSIAQRATLEAVGVKFAVVENGVHGSSMLVDERTSHDMSTTRALVIEWLQDATAQLE